MLGVSIPFYLANRQARILIWKTTTDFTFKKVESGRLQIGKSHKFLDAAQSLDMLEMHETLKLRNTLNK